MDTWNFFLVGTYNFNITKHFDITYMLDYLGGQLKFS